MNRFHKCVLAVFVLYLVLGNVPRLGPFFRSGGFPVTEVTLYLIGILGCLVYGIRMPRRLVLFSSVFVLSWSIGALMHPDLTGWEHFFALLYALRIACIVVTANYLGWILSRTLDTPGIVQVYAGIAVAQVAIGLAIYVLFPEATYLWSFLAQYDVIIAGDPHIRRLIGPIFDPNFFGNLLILPTSLVMASILVGKRRGLVPVLFLFLFAILLTYSRSSFVGLVVSLSVASGIILLRRQGVRYSVWRQVSYLSAVGTALAAILIIGTPGVHLRLLERMTTISADWSALNRLYHLHTGVEYLFSFPNFATGLGYNYIPFAVKAERIATGFDQSPITILVNLGFPLATLAIAFLWGWLARGLASLRGSADDLYPALAGYGVGSLVMSLFNNLLLLPLFLLSVLPLFAYGYWKGEAGTRKGEGQIE